MHNIPDTESTQRHLHPSAQEVLASSAQSRMDFLDLPFWLNHPSAALILERLERILHRLQTGRPEGLLIVGDPNNGKTHLLEFFLKKNLPVLPNDGSPMRIPVLYIQAPVGAVRSDLYRSLCEALHIPVPPRSALSRCQARIEDAMRDAEVKMIIIDELHNLVAGGEMAKRLIIDDLKTFSNKLKIALIGAGTNRALSAINIDDQYLSRMPPVSLPPWERGKNYRGLLKALEARLPLREPSNLSDRDLAELIYTHSRKTIGRTISLVLDATRLALQEGREKLNEDLIRRAASKSLISVEA